MDYRLGEFNSNPELLQKIMQSNVLLYCVVLLLTLKIVAVIVPINFPQNIFFADITKSALENFANQTRQSMGLPALVENQKLNQAAQLKAENMVANNYFDHTSPSGITPWFWFLKAGYNYKFAGENLAIGFFDSKEVYNAWLNSPSHKANIVNPNYTEVGTAVLSGFGQNNAIVVVQEFGSQQLAKQPATQTQPSTPAKTAELPPTANIKAPTADNNKKVLSQATESQNSIESPKGNTANNLLSKSLNFILYNYEALLQNIIYGISLIVIGILLSLIFFNFDISPVESREAGILPEAKLFNGVNFKRQFVFRSVLIIILLSTATLLNKEIIISFIPHQILI